VVALTILVAGRVTDISLPATGLAGAALVAVLVRLTLTFRAHQAMLVASQTEALTGLGNRRAPAGALARRLDHASPEPIILALLDLDGFKSYGDRFGHAEETGDAEEALRLADQRM